MILDGKEQSRIIKLELKEKANELISKNIIPTLAIILIGDNQASKVYVRNKLLSASECNIQTKMINLSEDTSEIELLEEITKINNDETIHGLIVQLPLPKHINEQTVINAIDSKKDVDGFTINNKGKLFTSIDTLAPATPQGIMKLIERYNIDLTGKHVVVVGRSNIVGKPIALMCLEQNATVTICHSRTKDLKSFTQLADVLIVAIGKAKFITKDMVKENVIVIDVGINRDENGKLCGDVDFKEVEKLASFITPVPKGVGPMTIASLLENTIKAASMEK